MTTENRALSVSYGSFSVKLEGFDDPFKIMRRVTEYFRSIAAVDPTFGQKPLIEDLGVLEAIETAVFNDDVSLETEGSIITLRPKELEVPRDVFVLGNTDLAPAEERVIPAPVDESLMDMTAEQQIALVTTPLDLREMAQNHEEMPFVGKGPQALESTPTNQTQAADIDAVLAQLDTAEPEAPLELHTVEKIVETASIEEAGETRILDTLAKVDIIDSEVVNSAPKYRSLRLNELEPAPVETTKASGTDETQFDMRGKIKAAIAALEAKEAQAAQIEPPESEPTSTEETPDLQEPAVEQPTIDAPMAEQIVAQDPVVEETAVDLRNQEPVDKRPLRIIRNEYAYEEPEASETPTKAPEAPSIAVNPFRKFPKRETEAAPAPIAETPMAEGAASTAPKDDLISTYRKLRSEHG